jgi:ribosomal protein S18 acetylase RimI-like enzyme
LAKEATMTAIPRPSVRAATVLDAPELAAIHARSWQAAYQDLLPQEFLSKLDLSNGTEQWERALRAAEWPKAGVMVAVPGPEMVGFARFAPARDSGEDTTLVAEIRQIYIAPEVWGRGLGKRLMSTALARIASSGYSQATLWVLDSNSRARRFYERCGWRQDGASRCNDSYGFPIADVRYRKHLT